MRDGAALTFALACGGQPVSIAYWRDLGGWPTGDPYRSIGVEPMLGRVFDLAEAGRATPRGARFGRGGTAPDHDG